MSEPEDDNEEETPPETPVPKYPDVPLEEDPGVIVCVI